MTVKSSLASAADTTRNAVILAESQGYAGGRHWRALPARRVEGVRQPVDLVAYADATA